MTCLFLVLVFPPQRPVIEIAITADSRLLRSEFESDWKHRSESDASNCRHWRIRRNCILWNWDLRFIDLYDIDHPGYTAIRLSKYQKWRRLPDDYWRMSTAPIQWIGYEVQVWHSARDSEVVFDQDLYWHGVMINRESYIQMPWHPGRPSKPHVPEEVPIIPDYYGEYPHDD